MTNLDSILKSRDIILPTKVRLVKAMFSPVVMHECESWTIKKAEHRRIDAFELWYDGSDGKASACNVVDLGSTPGSGRSPGEENGNPLQCSCLGNPRDGGAWWAAVYGVAQSWTRLMQLNSSSSNNILNYLSLRDMDCP